MSDFGYGQWVGEESGIDRSPSAAAQKARAWLAKARKTGDAALKRLWREQASDTIRDARRAKAEGLSR